MCLIAFHWRPDHAIPLVIAANRDEFYERPTAPLAWWEGGRILAGRDLRAGGTWMGVTRDGRCAALTNVRDPRLARGDAASRGQIPVRFLEGVASASAFLGTLEENAFRHNAFNLLLFDGEELLGYESRNQRVIRFAAGLHAVSNGDFDEPWPKVEVFLKGLEEELEDDDRLLARLADDQPYEDDQLPHTGVPLAWERALSPIFVRTPTYGTRASTLLRLGRRTVTVLEQGYSPEGPAGRSQFAFDH